MDIAEDYPEANLQSMDFAINSASFFQASIDPSQLDLSQIEQWPAINLYTTVSSNDRQVFGVTYSGTILLNVDVWMKVRQDLGYNGVIEDMGDALEDAVIQCLYAAATGLHIYGVSPQKNFSCIKDPAELLGDGWVQRIPILIPCEVNA